MIKDLQIFASVIQHDIFGQLNITFNSVLDECNLINLRWLLPVLCVAIGKDTFWNLNANGMSIWHCQNLIYTGILLGFCQNKTYFL